jgi:Wzt C-terminal domain
MYLRLAFAVAAHLEVDIMVVDEVLAVGDADFQRKCLGKMGSLEREGRTVVFVSHNLDAIERLCSTVAWLDRGRVVAVGPARETINAYLTAGLVEVPERVFAASGEPAQFRSARIVDVSGRLSARLRRDQPVTIEIDLEVLRPVPTLDASIQVTSSRGVRILDEAWSDSASPERGTPGRYVATMVIPPVLNVGEYYISLWLGSAYETFSYIEDGPRFQLEGTTMGRPDRAVQLGLAWEVRRAQLLSGCRPTSDGA